MLHTVRTVCLAALVALAFASAAHAVDVVEQVPVVPVRTITVQGLAERYVVPDQAIITVNLNAVESELVQARASHDRKLNKLMLIARDAGIDKNKIRANASNVQPNYESVRDKITGKHTSVLTGYRVFSGIDITVEDTNKLPKLLDAITTAGFENNQGRQWGQLLAMRYEIGNPQIIRDEMLTEALANAKAKADNLAAASGKRITNVVQIAENGVSIPRPPMPLMMRGSAMMEMAAAAPMAVAPPAGEQMLSATVTITYEIQ